MDKTTPSLRPRRVPTATLERMATYLRLTADLMANGVTMISSSDVEEATGVSAAQFRKDLSYFGEFGTPGVGYPVAELRQRLTAIMNTDREHPVIMAGAGNLGRAVAMYEALPEQGFKIVAVFDKDPRRIGSPVGGVLVQPAARLGEITRQLKARIGLIAVPAAAAQDVAMQMVDAGIIGILNFAPVSLKVPSTVMVRNVSLRRELALIAYHLSLSEDPPS